MYMDKDVYGYVMVKEMKKIAQNNDRGMYS